VTYKDLKAKSAAELKKMDQDLRLELFQLKLKKKTAQLEKTHQLNLVRRDIARVQMRMAEVASGAAK
jgi:large subunit ribosomal protein L29